MMHVTKLISTWFVFCLLVPVSTIPAQELTLLDVEATSEAPATPESGAGTGGGAAGAVEDPFRKVRRWRARDHGETLVSRDFHPSLHTPAFVNDITVTWKESEFRWFPPRVDEVDQEYSRGICLGMTRLTAIYFWQITLLDEPTEALEDALRGCFWPERHQSLPIAERRQKLLREYSSPDARRNLLAERMASTQLGDPQQRYLTIDDPAAFLERICLEIEEKGTCPVDLFWNDPDGKRRGHAVLAYAVIRSDVQYEPTGRSLGRARPRRSVQLIKFWDPNTAHLRGVYVPTRAGEPDQDAAAYDPATGELTLTSFMIQRYAGLQPGDRLLVGRDAFLDPLVTEQCEKSLRAAFSGPVRRTDVDRQQSPGLGGIRAVQLPPNPGALPGPYFPGGAPGGLEGPGLLGMVR